MIGMQTGFSGGQYMVCTAGAGAAESAIDEIAATNKRASGVLATCHG
jgi:hypothetical protein